MALVDVQHISKHQPDRIIVDDISFQQEALQKIAITGESGAGKSTLLKIISGHVQTDSGVFYEVEVMPKDVKIVVRKIITVNINWR